MVGLHVEEGAKEVESIGSEQRDGNVPESFIVAN